MDIRGKRSSMIFTGEAEKDARECLETGAACVQINFTEGRLALKLDPSGGVLNAFIDLNNRYEGNARALTPND
jgi:hypothetical protein